MSEKETAAGGAVPADKPWFYTGFDKSREVQKENDEKMNREKSDYFKLEDKETRTVRFLSDDPVCVFEHGLKIDGKYRTFTCLQGSDMGECPLCGKKNVTRRFVGYLSVFDIKEGKVMIYKAGVRVLRHLDKFAGKYKTLKDRTFDISRTGKDTSTTYAFIPNDKSDMSPQEETATLIDFRTILKPKSKEDILKALSGGHVESADDRHGGTAEEEAGESGVPGESKGGVRF